MKATRHNGRNASYSAKHNDRRFNLKSSDHNDPERKKLNVYWDRYRGFTTDPEILEVPENKYTFEQIEKKFYFERYGDYIDGQCARNAARRHSDRDRTTEDLRLDKRTCPEETILQVGNIDGAIPGETLFEIMVDYQKRFAELFGKHVHIIDWALHVDEATPHIHERHVFDYTNSHGEIQPAQDKALEALGIERPDPDKKQGRNNNRKQTFDKIVRALFLQVCKDHGLQIDEEPEYGGRAYLEKQEYIIAKQKEKIAELEKQEAAAKVSLGEVAAQTKQAKAQLEEVITLKESAEEQLDEINLKLSDVNALMEELSDTVYDEVCKQVVPVAKAKTHEEDMKIITAYENKLTSPEKGFSEKKRTEIHNIFSNLKRRMNKAAEKVLEAVKNLLADPKVKKAIKRKAVEEARPSLVARLQQNRERLEDERRKSRERVALKREQGKLRSGDMEL